MEDKAIKIEQQEEHDYAKKQHQEQPPMKVTKHIKGGQSRDYYFLESVNSVEELDNIRFKNCCLFPVRKALPNFKSRTMPCTRKRSMYRYQPEKQCDFELLALRQYSESDTIYVYTHSQHNHPVMPEEKRAICRGAKELIPVENPPAIFRTPDNTEWEFVQTLPNYDQMQQFRLKNHCVFIAGRGSENYRRFRLPCCRKKSNCEFLLLALKTTSAAYHVYTVGEHNHAAIKPKKMQQPAACDHQQKEQGMEVGEEEEEEDDKNGQEENKANEEGEGNEPIEEGGLENEANPRVETLEEMLQKAIAKVYIWMAGIEPNQIGQTLEGWDNAALVQMADQEIRQHPEKFDLWRPWLKCAIKNCIQIEGFGAQYKDLISLMLDHVHD